MLGAAQEKVVWLKKTKDKKGKAIGLSTSQRIPAVIK